MRRGDRRRQRLLLGRHAVTLPDGERRYVCSDCYGRVRAKAIHEGISDERMVEVWTMMATGGWF